MKRVLILQPTKCGSNDFTEEKVYNVIFDKLIDFTSDKEIEYERKLWIENDNYDRYIGVLDDSGDEDSFQVSDVEDRFVVFEDDTELAVYLVKNIKGLDEALVNMYRLMN